MLVCAPSNTAVDELVYRLNQPGGVLNSLGEDWKPIVYRLGENSSSTHTIHGDGGWNIGECC